MDLSSLKNWNWFDIELPSLGSLQVRDLSFNGEADLEEAVEDEKVSASELVRRVILLTTHFKTVEIKEAKEDEVTNVTEEQVAKLSDNEVERFAEMFCKHNKSYFGFKKIENTTEDSGEEKKNYEAKIPREDGETYSDYLRRGLKSHLKRQRSTITAALKEQNALSAIMKERSALEAVFKEQNRFRDLLAGFKHFDDHYKNIGSVAAQLKDFATLRNLTKATDQIREHLYPLNRASDAVKSFIDSSSVSEALRRNAQLSDRLESEISAVRNVVPPPPPIEREFKVPHIPNPMEGTNNRLDAMMDRADRIVPLITSSAELIKDLNQTALTILAKFAQEAENSRKFAKVATTIAVLSFVATAAGTWLTWYQAQEQSKEAKEQAEIYNKQINTLVETQDHRTREILRTMSEGSTSSSDAIAAAVSKALKDALSEIEKRSLPKQ